MLVLLAALILVVELVRNHTANDAAALLAMLVVAGFGARRLLRDLRAHPAGFPAPTPSEGLRLGSPARRPSSSDVSG
jgi:hypothetical protein